MKFIVVGEGGSGKTTYANSLGIKNNIDVISLDKFIFKPDWQPYSYEEALNNLNAAIKDKDSWIIESLYGRSHLIRTRLINNLLKDATHVFILLSDVSKNVENIISRSLERAKDETIREYVETPAGIAKMLQNNIGFHDVNNAILYTLGNVLESTTNINVEYIHQQWI